MQNPHESAKRAYIYYLGLRSAHGHYCGSHMEQMPNQIKSNSDAAIVPISHGCGIGNFTDISRFSR